MKIFSYGYEKALIWAKHPHASYYLSVFSATEAIFFPIPVEVILAPMVLSEPKKAYFYAMIAAITSVLGAIVGFLLGALAYESLVTPFFEWMGYQHHFDVFQTWLTQWGFWVVFLAGFSPIPYKIFTLGSGAMGIAFIPFLLASLVSRSLRYLLVAALLKFFGEKVEPMLQRYIDRIGWAVVLLCLVGYLTYELIR